MSHRGPEYPVSRDVYEDPIVQLAAICPLCALAALSPQAALAALSPLLRVYNPAINPLAALLSFLSPPQSSVNVRVQRQIQVRLGNFRNRQLLRSLTR